MTAIDESVCAAIQKIWIVVDFPVIAWLHDTSSVVVFVVTAATVGCACLCILAAMLCGGAGENGIIVKACA